jgi:hypothetical protein
MAASINDGERTQGKILERTTDSVEASGKHSHIPTLAKSETLTHVDRGEMAVIHNGKHFRPIQGPH